MSDTMAMPSIQWASQPRATNNISHLYLFIKVHLEMFEMIDIFFSHSQFSFEPFHPYWNMEKWCHLNTYRKLHSKSKSTIKLFLTGLNIRRAKMKSNNSLHQFRLKWYHKLINWIAIKYQILMFVVKSLLSIISMSIIINNNKCFDD